MPLPPPPPPVPKEVFDERFKNGARTMEELDPAFHKWLESSRSQLKFQGICIMLGLALIGLMVIYIGINQAIGA